MLASASGSDGHMWNDSQRQVIKEQQDEHSKSTDNEQEDGGIPIVEADPQDTAVEPVPTDGSPYYLHQTRKLIDKNTLDGVGFELNGYIKSPFNSLVPQKETMVNEMPLISALEKVREI